MFLVKLSNSIPHFIPHFDQFHFYCSIGISLVQQRDDMDFALALSLQQQINQKLSSRLHLSNIGIATVESIQKVMISLIQSQDNDQARPPFYHMKFT
jgi:hypothetical protein